MSSLTIGLLIAIAVAAIAWVNVSTRDETIEPEDRQW